MQQMTLNLAADGLLRAAAMLLAVAGTAVAQEGKWVWTGRNINGAASTFPDQYARPLYRPDNYRPPAPVFETTDFTNSPPLLQPRPPRPGQEGAPGILTGPVPSWEQRPGDKLAYKDYEHCKCDYGFNCKSPGIKFGQCDADKQYCCFNPKSEPSFIPGRPPLNNNNNRGPESGYRGPEAGYRPPYDRPVLVGPGGPTGIVTEGGRPFRPAGPGYRLDPEEDVRPQLRPQYHSYGTLNDENLPRPPYDPFARSANVEAKKNGKKL